MLEHVRFIPQNPNEPKRFPNVEFLTFVVEKETGLRNVVCQNVFILGTQYPFSKAHEFVAEVEKNIAADGELENFTVTAIYNKNEKVAVPF